MNTLKAISSIVTLAAFVTTGMRAQQPASATGPDTLTSSSGDQLIGTLVGANNRNVTFKSALGELTVPWGSIKVVRVARSVTLRTLAPISNAMPSQSLTLDNPSIEPANGILGVSDSTNNFTIPLSNVESIGTFTQSLPLAERWFISLNPQANLISGTQSQQVYNGALNITHEQYPAAPDWHHQATTFIVNTSSTITKKPGSSPVHLHEYDGTFQHRIYFSKRYFGYGVAEGFHNSSFGLYLQQSYGAGLGGTLVTRKRYEINASVDARFIAEHFYRVPSLTFPGVRFSQGSTLRLFPTPAGFVELAETASYTLAVGEKKAWEARGTTLLDIPISSSFGVTFRFSDDYLENAANARKNYSKFTAGVRYSFKRP